LSRRLCSYWLSIFTSTHSSNFLKNEKKVLIEELNRIKTENAGSDRLLKQLHNFNSKRDKEHKEQEEREKNNTNEIDRLNEDLKKLRWNLETWRRKLTDPALLKRQIAITNELNSTFNGVEIDRQIAKSRIIELKGKSD